jgi:hypothetical protein
VCFTPEEPLRGHVDCDHAMSPAHRNAIEASGIHAFRRDGSGAIFHTHSPCARGLEPFIGTLMICSIARRRAATRAAR